MSISSQQSITERARRRANCAGERFCCANLSYMNPRPDHWIEFMKLILLLTLGAITSVSVMAPTPTAMPSVMAPTLKVTSHCTPEEKVIFSCATTNAKVISLCSSSPLTPSDGYLQYRFGSADRPELVYPVTKEHPSKHFQFGTQIYSGGGAEFLKFRNGEYT